jgi:hypothetical protein
MDGSFDSLSAIVLSGRRLESVEEEPLTRYRDGDLKTRLGKAER